MAAITLVFVAGTAAFAAFLVRVIGSHEVEGLDVAFMVAAGLVVTASALVAVRRRPATESASIADVYAASYEYERVEH
ncbi:hypothetical protein ACFV0L_18825 [Streptosporangium canum]|uniref:hypothetical protein n=1 Tax=Streptosporangium canum TaxID=324952 RepID=UPI0036BDD60D